MSVTETHRPAPGHPDVELDLVVLRLNDDQVAFHALDAGPSLRTSLYHDMYYSRALRQRVSNAKCFTVDR